MFALVESGSITKMLSGNRGITIGDLQYPKEIFTLWTKSEREAIGVYEVEMDTSKRKEERWYNNTNVTYTFGSGKVTGSYGDAAAKDHEDTKYTNQDKTDGKIPTGKDVGDVKVEGLKTKLIRTVKAQAAGILQDTDWYVVRKADAGTAIPSSITTHRNSVRNKQAEMETKILDASNVAALEALYTYTTDGSGVQSRPLGELPRLDS